MRQKTNMFILSCRWRAPRHVSLSVYMNAGREFICILSVQTNVLTGHPSISWVISASQLIGMLKPICDAFTVRQRQFLGLIYSRRSTWSRSFSAHLVTSILSLPPRSVPLLSGCCSVLGFLLRRQRHAWLKTGRPAVCFRQLKRNKNLIHSEQWNVPFWIKGFVRICKGEGNPRLSALSYNSSWKQ